MRKEREIEGRDRSQGGQRAGKGTIWRVNTWKWHGRGILTLMEMIIVKKSRRERQGREGVNKAKW